MSDSSGVTRLPAAVPLFPLPNVVLFPNAVLPLHVFEERYKKMTADVLRTHRRIAMALLRPGWEKNYYGRPAIEPVVCVGAILSHERLADGRYNFLLQGQTRARVVREVGEAPYRQAELEPLDETEDTEFDLADVRRRLTQLFERDSYAALPGGGQVRRLLAAAGVPTGVIADLLAFNVLSDDQVALKQSLLAEARVRSRVERIIESVEALRPAWRNTPESASFN
jgi:Lon protease-like protein